ncbi:MAG: hypothetical protein IT176_01195 [Acidobacteria bacterium]|nr:hypothetical protein [Acidobacteriota bacterium]
MNPDRLHAIVEHGFTERQARFLDLVMRHAGVCVPRQYAQVAGIAQGAKCNAFFDRLVRRGHARAIECIHNRARLYLVHSRLLYHAIGEPSSRYRRAMSPRLALERVMLLDAMLSTPVDQWLTTPAEKVAALPLTTDMKSPDGFPIGLQADGRIVVLYLAPEPWPDALRTFLRAHASLLQSVPQWTLRIVLPRRFGHAHDDYQRAVHEELESSLSAALITDLKRYFECRRDIHVAGDPQADDVFRAGHRRFSTPRFDDLYRRWIKHGDEAFDNPSSVAITEALESGAGRVESFVLPHSYRHLSPLVGQSRSNADEVEKGDQRGDTTRRHSQPRASTPWRSHERPVVM